MPARVVLQRRSRGAAVVPGFALPGRLLNDRDEVQVTATRHKVVDEVAAGAHPVGGFSLDAEMGDAFDWNDAAIGDVTGEPRLFGAEQFAPDRGMNPVRPDHQICLDYRTALEHHLDAIVLLYEADTSPPHVRAIRWDRAADDAE